MKAKLKVLVTLIGVAILLLQGCSSSPSGSDRYKYTMHDVQVINENSRDVVDFHLEMIGSDECVDIKSISEGDDTNHMTFSLPVLEEVEGEKPISWGDYIGYYSQNGLKRDIFIYNYKHNFCQVTTIKMDAESYKVIFSEL